jgi:RNA 2',3'-cyclic 3'-phosphodiesterase
MWPDAAAQESLDNLAAIAAERCGGQRMRRDSLHITLAFIGAVSPSQFAVLQDIAGRISAQPFDLRIDRLGYWPHNRILWAGCNKTPSRQRRLFAVLTEALVAAGFPLDKRQQVPHVTLLRQANCDGLPEIGEHVRWHVKEFVLVESILQPSGARYRVLAGWPLRE